MIRSGGCHFIENLCATVITRERTVAAIDYRQRYQIKSNYGKKEM